MTPAAAAIVPATRPVAPSSSQAAAHSPTSAEEDPGAAVPVDEPQHQELHADDDRGVGGEGEADGARRHLADLPRERGEAGLHLPVAHEARQEGERGDPQHRRLAQDGEVAGAGRRRARPSGACSGRPATCRSGPSSRPRGTRVQAASTRKIAVNVPGRSTLVRKPLTMPPIPMPRLTRAKLMPKNWVRSGPETMLEVRALNPGQPTPKAMPSSVNASDERRAPRWRTPARRAPQNWATVPQMTTARAPSRSISAPTGPVTTSATTAIRPMSRPGDVERDAAHLVHVDDRERQGHAPPDGGDRRRGQQPPARSWAAGSRTRAGSAGRVAWPRGSPGSLPLPVLGGLGHRTTVP